MDRFGAPAEVHRKESGLQWLFRPNERQWISFYFMAGRVYLVTAKE